MIGAMINASGCTLWVIQRIMRGMFKYDLHSLKRQKKSEREQESAHETPSQSAGSDFKTL